MPELALRPLRAEEQAAVFAWAAAEQWPGLVKGQPLTPDAFAQILVLPGHHSHALGEPVLPAVGFGQIWVAPNGSTNLVRLLVDPVLRGRGLGKRLCALLLEEALRLPGTAEVRLRVRRDNRPAIAVYRGLGFETREAQSHEYALSMVFRR